MTIKINVVAGTPRTPREYFSWMHSRTEVLDDPLEVCR